MGEGPQLKTWDDVERFDDVVIPENKRIISELEKTMETRCPHLRKIGDFFYYCSKKVSGEPDPKPSPNNPIYQNIIGVAELQLWCMDSYETCVNFTGKPQQ